MARLVQGIRIALEVLMNLMTDREIRILASIAVVSTIGMAALFVAILMRLHK